MFEVLFILPFLYLFFKRFFDSFVTTTSATKFFFKDFLEFWLFLEETFLGYCPSEAHVLL